MKKIPLIHGKFRAKNNPMKFHFAVFMGREMIFMGFSHEIHGIFIKLQFIVFVRLLFSLRMQYNTPFYHLLLTINSCKISGKNEEMENHRPVKLQ